jgi:hypothetical protein
MWKILVSVQVAIIRRGFFPFDHKLAETSVWRRAGIAVFSRVIAVAVAPIIPILKLPVSRFWLI